MQELIDLDKECYDLAITKIKEKYYTNKDLEYDEFIIIFKNEIITMFYSTLCNNLTKKISKLKLSSNNLMSLCIELFTYIKYIKTNDNITTDNWLDDVNHIVNRYEPLIDNISLLNTIIYNT